MFFNGSEKRMLQKEFAPSLHKTAEVTSDMSLPSYRNKQISYFLFWNQGKKNGALGGGRTHNLHLRRVALYPIELRVHAYLIIYSRFSKIQTENRKDFKKKRVLHDLLQTPSSVSSGKSAENFQFHRGDTCRRKNVMFRINFSFFRKKTFIIAL